MSMGNKQPVFLLFKTKGLLFPSQTAPGRGVLHYPIKPGCDPVLGSFLQKILGMGCTSLKTNSGTRVYFFARNAGNAQVWDN